MAHIIRIKECQSRYQTDLQRYPSQFTRIKKERWHYLQESWQREFAEGLRLEYEDLNEKASILTLWNKAVSQVKRISTSESAVNEKQRKEDAFQVLKKQYKQEIFEMQLLWAGVKVNEPGEQFDLAELSQDKWLKWLALELPDNCFVFYKPVMYVKRAEIELDVIVISPAAIYCLTLLKGDPLSVFEATSERYWVEYIHQERRNRLSPIPTLERMAKILNQLLADHQLDLPIQSFVVAPESIIDNRTNGLKFECLDKRTFDAWKMKLVQSQVPLKYQQVKAAECLLKYCEPNRSNETSS
ncbi:nuclease-related domain-containing protein [Alkalicoccobacillus porphyridii]|uniref:NERD domain-containing protein n=1 Tax=Alkalicoccobacillus porphyridii TaxID=2597270 RepID=A0A554A385_9BACI|nr:nuclease-related domain-containing protein [Alkalicoccobacillus porphyridii]TSB48106.1 NERD domain-containing protein [Alkalicoccobacillus porphyridii]